MDVLLVILYFILVRQVDLRAPERALDAPRYEPSPEPEAFWTVVIFGGYLVWDVLSKIFAHKGEKDAEWRSAFGVRILVTVIVLAIAWITYFAIRGTATPWVPVADFALLCIYLLFCAGKDCASAYFPEKREGSIEPTAATLAKKKRWAVGSSIVLFSLLILSATWSQVGWLPKSYIDAVAQPVKL